jgi:NTE family protein
MTRTALVISGGGPKGAFAVGAVQVLAERGIAFDIVCGTSTGALIAPLVVTSRTMPGELALLEQIYTSVETADIVTLRPLVAAFLHGAAVSDALPLRRLIERVITGERWEVIRRAAMQMFVAAVPLQTGRAEYFQAGGPPSSATVAVVNAVRDREELVRAIWASACEPVLTPPVDVRDQAARRQYVDGGLCDYFPAGIAIDNGATDIYAVILRPLARETADEDYTDVPKVLMRTLDVLSAEVGDGNVRSTELYTRAVRYLAAVRAAVQHRFRLSDEEVASLFRPTGVDNPFASKKAVRLTIIRPDVPLVPAAATDAFDPTAMAVMLEKGRAQAKKALGLATS